MRISVLVPEASLLSETSMRSTTPLPTVITGSTEPIVMPAQLTTSVGGSVMVKLPQFGRSVAANSRTTSPPLSLMPIACNVAGPS